MLKRREHTKERRRDAVDNKKLLNISVVMLVLSLSAFISTVLIQQKNNAQPESPIPFAGYNSNTPVTMGLATTEITKVSFSDGVPGFSASSDTHYIIVEFKVKNNSDHPINVLPSSDTYVKTDSGVVSYMTPFNLERPFRAGALLPGENIEGQLSYLVAKKGGAKLLIDSIWSGGVVSYRIQ